MLFNSDTVNLVWKTRGGEGKHYFVSFCFLEALFFFFVNFCSFRLCHSKDNVPG